jgi:hypothetical protein
VLLAAALCTVVLATPAAAARELSLRAPEAVTTPGAMELVATGAVGPVVVTITDSSGAVAMWRVRPSTDLTDRPLTVDLESPDEGTAPVNGPATVTLQAVRTDVAGATTTLDRSPTQPDLTTIVRGQRVGVRWSAAGFPGPVTYRLERIITGGQWVTLHDGASADGHTDRDLQPGRYRYRLTTAIPGADGQPRWSQPAAAQVHVVAPPEPAPPALPEPSQPELTPAASEPARDPRPVAATGEVRRTIAPQPPRRQRLRTAIEPAVEGSAPVSSGVPTIAVPEAAGPSVLTPAVAAPQFETFPVVVPPAGALAVQSARTFPAIPLLLLGGLAVAAACAGGVSRLRRRRSPVLVSPVPGGPR